MSGANTIAVALDHTGEAVTMVLTEAELLIVTYFRGGKVSAEQLEAALASAAGRAKPGP